MPTRSRATAPTTRLPEPPDAAPPGGETVHVPVLSKSTIELLQPRPGDVFLDGTFGGGGHARLILERIQPGGLLLAMDRDPAARRRAEALEREFGAAFRFVPGDFADCAAALADLPPRGAGAPDDRGDRPLDGALLDLGLSSFQLADPGRGFAFSQDGPLDMRFDPDEGGPTAAEVVNRYPEERLRQVLFDLGQESWAARIAAAVVRERRKAPLLTTSELASLVARVIPRPKWPRRIHPATRTFQALRMEVNDELGSLRRGLEEIERHLRPGGRFGVISFHSLEDKAVKRFFDVESRDCICPPRQPVCTCGHRAGVIILTPHPARPSEDEVDLNPRSRSARLRVAQRLP